MHEATLAARVLAIAGEAAANQPGRVATVTVIVGELAGVMPDALAFAFDTLKRGTPLANARLLLEKQAVGAHCRDCGAEFAPTGFPYACPACGSGAFTIVRGEDFEVKELEMQHDEG